MDECDPALLIRTVTLNSTDLAAIARSTTCTHAQSVLRWLTQILGTTSDRTLVSGLLLTELEAAARAEGLIFATTLHTAETNLPDPKEQALLPSLPRGANLAEFKALPPNHLNTMITQLSHEMRRHLTGTPFTSRLELGGGLLRLFLRHEHLITQLATPDQPKIILDATANASLLRAIFPDTPIHMEQPPRDDQAMVIQVITRDWAKSTLHGDRRTQWYDTVAQQIRPGRPTLVVCTQETEDDLRHALAERGHTDAEVAHYGALRGSNAYKGYDVVLSQIYNPNLDSLVREGRALFADDTAPLDERVITTNRELTDASGARWMIAVTTFADPRLAALLESKREAEMLQCAMRGRPRDHPEAQITLLFSMPLPGLTPTEIRESEASPTSNGGRQATALLKIIASMKMLMAGGQTRFTVMDLAQAAQVSEVTVRTHWRAVAEVLGLKDEDDAAPSKRRRSYRRRVLVSTAIERDTVGESTDQADNKDSITCLIHTDEPAQSIAADMESVPVNEEKPVQAVSVLLPHSSDPLAMNPAPCRPPARFVHLRAYRAAAGSSESIPDQQGSE